MTLSSSSGVTSTVSVAYTPGMGLNAYGVRMVYESTDVPSTTGGSSSSSTMASSSSASGTGGSHSGSGGTSGGTIAAAVVVPVVALLALGALFLWWRKRRQRNARVEVEAPSGTPKFYTGVPSVEPKVGELPVEQSNRGELPGEPARRQEHFELQ